MRIIILLLLTASIVLAQDHAAYAPGGTIPRITQAQVDALTKMTTDILPLIRALDAARSANSPTVKQAELDLANARSKAFAAIQDSPNRLAPDQVEAFMKMGGSFANVAFTLPEPYNFAEHTGFVSLFDGQTLKGWDGNPKF